MLDASGKGIAILSGAPHDIEKVRPGLAIERLNVESEVNDVTIGNCVVFTLKSPLTGFFGAGLAFEINKVIVGNHLGPDKTFLEVCVNDASSLGRGGTHFYGPCSNFFWASREIGL